MATYQMVPVEKLEPPHNPQRQETLMEGMDEFRDSIRSKGLQQPIGVQVEGESYRIIWGHRRSIAATQLGWSHIAAMVYEEDELIDADALMGAENYHRVNTSDREEALYYKRILPKYPEGTVGMARELNVPQSRIEDLLMLADGDERVFNLLGERKLSISQAKEINKFSSPGYRLQATNMATRDGVSGDRLRLWRRDIQRQGLDQDAHERQEVWSVPLPAKSDQPMGLCQIGNHSVPLQLRKVYEICNEHYNIFLEGLEALGRQRVLEEAGLFHHVTRLLRVAEGEEINPNGPVRSGNTGGS